MTHLIARRAREHPGEIGLRDERVALTWPELEALLNRTANCLRSAPLGPAMRVAVFAENSAETVVVHIASLMAGVSSVPVNFHFTADEAAYVLRDSQATVLFVSPETHQRGLQAAVAAGVPLVVGWRCAHPGVISFEEWIAEAGADAPPGDLEPLPNLMYTSGTTGVPKGVDFAPTMFPRTPTVTEHVDEVSRNPFARLGTHLVVGPLYHTGPISGMRCLAAGVPVVVLARFDPIAVLEAVDRFRVESTLMVPTHFIRMLALPAADRGHFDVSSMRLVAHTGSVCPVEVKHRMINWFGPVFRDSYGATEVGTTCMIHSDEWLDHPGSVGRAVAPFTALVVDDDGAEVPAGVEGRLFFIDATGRGVVYPGDPAKTAAAHLRPGVFTLGEIGYVSSDGYVYLTDRSTDMIVSGGVNIYPAEAELALGAHPAVTDVAVIGVPDTEMGESVVALVVLDTSLNAAPSSSELIAWCRERIAGYKCPRAVVTVESVQRTAMGKINKRELRNRLFGQPASLPATENPADRA